MTAAGLIFSNIHDISIPEMTAERTMASIPFGGRYRLVDFTLSNMVNSGIDKVGIITHNNYRSLMDHIGNGKDWDLARRSGGIRILPPYVSSSDSPIGGKLYTNRLEAMLGAIDFINHCDEEVVVLSDCDDICNIDLNAVLDYHEAKGADVTFVTKKMNLEGGKAGQYAIINADAEGNVTEIVDSSPMTKGEFNVCTNIVVINTGFLVSTLHTSVSYGYKDFYTQALAAAMASSKFVAYDFDGYYAEIGSLPKYFADNMEILRADVRNELFNTKDRPVYTKVRNTAPTKYAEGAVVKNSVIADGCVIEGTVINSVLFRGVRVRKGTVVKNSVMMQDSCTGENVQLNCVITDKNVTIRDDVNLSGHETQPFYVAKGKMI